MTDQPTTQAQTFNEAPASWNVRYLTVDGFDCQLTLRDMVASDLVKRIPACLDWLRDNGAQPTRVPASTTQQQVQIPPVGPAMIPSAPASAPAPVKEEMFEVSSISHGATDNGVDYMLVKGGKYQKFGLKCWEENVPVIASKFKEWPIGQTYAAPDGMQYAIVHETMKDGTSHKKIVGFRSE